VRNGTQQKSPAAKSVLSLAAFSCAALRKNRDGIHALSARIVAGFFAESEAALHILSYTIRIRKRARKTFRKWAYEVIEDQKTALRVPFR